MFNHDVPSLINLNYLITAQKEIIENHMQKRAKCVPVLLDSAKEMLIDLGPLKASATQGCTNTPNKKGKKMYRTDCDGDYVQTAEEKRTSYLRERAYEVYNAKNTEGYEAFGMTGVNPPKSREEATKWLKEGRFEFKGVDDPKLDFQWNRGWGTWLDYFSWTDPDRPRDEKGFKEFEKLNAKTIQDTLDVIMSGDYAAGLEAVRAYEALAVK